MPLFSIKGDKLEKVKEVPFKSERKDIQRALDIHPQKNQLKLWINLPKGELDDPKKIARDVSNIEHWGNGDYEVFVKPALMNSIT